MVSIQHAVKCLTIIPIALHQLVILNSEGNSMITLKVYDKSFPSSDFSFYIENLPTYGEVKQLSQVYSSYGYDPIDGYRINTSHSVVTDTKNRIYYKTNHGVKPPRDTLSYIAVNKKNGCVSTQGLITIAPDTGILAGSDFLINSENWNIVGNKEIHGVVEISHTSITPLLSHYIYGSDNIVNSNTKDPNDKSIWYFQAPDKFLGNIAIAYGGQLEFTIAAFSGDFSKMHPLSYYAVILECTICNEETGARLGFPIANIHELSNFTGKSTKIIISLNEYSGWLLDVGISYKDVSTKMPNKCEFINILSKLSSIKILGDLTVWYETIALDNIFVKNQLDYVLPICN